MIVKRIVNWLWLKYYTVLWCTRCYMWCPIKNWIELGFEHADYQIRKRVGKFLGDDFRR